MQSVIKKLFLPRFMVKPDMLVGEIPSTKSIYRRTIDVAWPAALEAILVSLIASVDTVMVGALSPQAISAVGITTQPKFIILAFILCLNIGVTVITARRKGENDRDGANRCMRQSIVISLIVSLALSVLGYVFARPIMIFAGAQEDILADAVVYFEINMIGMVWNAVALTITAAQRGIGNTKISMKTNLTANIVNLILNYLLITGEFGFPRWEVAGAAIATIIGNFIACIMSFLSVMKKDGFLHLHLHDDWRFDRETIGSIMHISSSALVEQLSMRFGLLLYAIVVAGLGTLPFAAHQIGMNVLNLSYACGDGLGVASSSLVGQSLGAKRPDMAIIYGKTTQRIAFGIATCLCLLFIFAREPIVTCFNRDPYVVQASSEIMLIIAFVSFPQTSYIVMSGCLRGGGDTKYVAMISLISIMVIRPGISWLLCYPAGLGLVGAWFGVLIDQSLRLTLCTFRFRTGKWTRIRV